ncbi:SPP1 gp7 family putative phage head morphogenesis protein [Salibacterium salarium]|uniref:phage head morphogenesis protein n=1 Tax=Salibacterium salarium TaxID=284579 RepID=UPI00278AB356|nr:minor capsid protein [Salibacterium salarium]MDQ0299649.1 SPP1 gp7 family putative phage head morphogenesis protein [Salibacterium salarium]
MPVPNSQFPTAVAVQYARRLQKLVDENRKLTWEKWKNEIKPLIHTYRERNDSLTLDEDELSEIEAILEEIEDSAAEIFGAAIIEKLAEEFVGALNRRQKERFREQFQAVIGVDPIENNSWLESFMNTAVKENVSYIRSIDREYHNRIETIIIQGVRRGKSMNDMVSEIKRTSGVSKSRAKFIARDQVGSIYGDLTKKRQEEMGLKRFRWRTANDKRVRDSHEKLHDKVFTWKKGADGLYPGTDFNCRCVAEPLEEELFDFD